MLQNVVLAPLPHEPVLNKLFASAFFGTPLQSLLAAHDCDSVLVTGASTSGCVRATAVDVLQNGYRLVIPREAVGDRSPAAHSEARDGARLNPAPQPRGWQGAVLQLQRQAGNRAVAGSISSAQSGASPAQTPNRHSRRQGSRDDPAIAPS